MSNTYFVTPKPSCTCCGRPYDRLCIGISAAGWCFALDVTDTIRDLPDWERIWSTPGATITDESGAFLSPEQMRAVITERSRLNPPWEKQPAPHGLSWKIYHRERGSEPGPNGLLRHRIDGECCVGHGAGTWDLFHGLGRGQ